MGVLYFSRYSTCLASSGSCCAKPTDNLHLFRKQEFEDSCHAGGPCFFVMLGPISFEVFEIFAFFPAFADQSHLQKAGPFNGSLRLRTVTPFFRAGVQPDEQRRLA